MKMKQLREKLSAEGFTVSERMVKYYIETGLLPQPDYPHPNQARYADIHFLRLCKIGALKERGCVFSDIRREMTADNEAAESFAEKNGISLRDALLSYEIFAREQADYLAAYYDKNVKLSRDELAEALSCEKMIFDLAVDTGALENKTVYGLNDMRILASIRDLFKLDSENGRSDVIEKISEVSKINNLAAQYVHLLEDRPERKWLYDEMLAGFTDGKTEQLCKKNTN